MTAGEQNGAQAPGAERIKFIATGGTIDKIYFDRQSEYQVGEPQVVAVLEEANVDLAYEVLSLMRKDSLEMNEADRLTVRRAVEEAPERCIVVTHGTDTMVETARALAGVRGKVVVFTGAMQPARFRMTDAVFNVACAVTAVQTLPEGVYIAMNGRIFDPWKARKNRRAHRFETGEGER